MADERYQWLDQEAAERLLRGEPVDAVDDRARSGAQRLAEALDAARTPAVPPAARTELPGEAAALAAFRQATAARVDVTAAPAPGHTTHADLGRVRLAPVAAPRRRWGRSVRYGLAAAVAAVTVGGVAVAAGTGVLPMVGPAPASSVTAGGTADPLVSVDPGIREDPEAPPAEPGGSGDPAPGVSPSAGTGTTAPATGGTDGPGTATPGQGTSEPGRSTEGTPTGPGPSGTGGAGGSGEDSGATGKPGTMTLREMAVKACREYRSGKLDATGRKRLTGTLRDGETLRRYCDRLLDGGTGPSEGDGEDDGTGGAKDDSDGRSDGRYGNAPGDSRDDRRDGTGNSRVGAGRPGDGRGVTGAGDRRGSDRRESLRHADDRHAEDRRTDDRRGAARSVAEPGESVLLAAAAPPVIAVTARVPLPV
ncbi:hypothetical protein [Streptomyces sp. NPDC002057]|uniref:hypothetical protein n=1 Tax=Streptomyces sp. NPDC002057 TaxID=3154664 RepID=UPI00332D23E3